MLDHGIYQIFKSVSQQGFATHEVYVVESWQSHELLLETVPYGLIACPVCAQVLTAGFYAPLYLLTGYGAAGTGVAHFTGQVTEVAKVYVHVYGHCASGSLMLITVGKVFVSRTLLKTVFKCGPGKDCTFLIAFQSTTVAI
jgi:hypothetical protein